MSGMNLYDASEQWAKRPADQRFGSLEEMRTVCRGYANSARQAVVPMDAIVINSPDDHELCVVGPSGVPAKLTHWSFGQLCNRANAPAGYLRSLPAPLAANCLTNGLTANREEGAKANVLFHQNGSLICRSFTSDDYARIWNADLVERLQAAQECGWRVPPARPAFEGQPGSRPATEDDVLQHRTTGGGLSINVGDMIAPAGLYASDHDMFAFMMNENFRIEDGSDGGLSRGFFVQNSEVGASALKLTRFLLRHCCGNHICWDVKDVKETRIIHRGHNDRRYARELRSSLWSYANESCVADQQRVTSAKACILGHTKDDVIDRLFVAKILPRKTLEAAYDHAVQEADLRSTGTSPRSAWGMCQGVTALSQKELHADSRAEMDRAGGKILSIAF